MKQCFFFFYRQLREEIRERKDRLESIFRPKQNRLRPESPGRTPAPGGTRRRPSRSRVGSTSVGGRTQGDSVRPSPRGEQRRGGPSSQAPPPPPPPPQPILNSHEATPIDETEEQERHLAMEKRAVLLRSLGVVDAVYRLLAGSPGVEPSSGLPKKVTLTDQDKAKHQSMARTVEIVLSQFPNSSTNSKCNLILLLIHRHWSRLLRHLHHYQAHT